MRADAYSLATHPLTPSRVNPKRSTAPPNGGDYGSAAAYQKKMRRDNKRYSNDYSNGSIAKNIKKRKRAYE